VGENHRQTLCKFHSISQEIRHWIEYYDVDFDYKTQNAVTSINVEWAGCVTSCIIVDSGYFKVTF
jgi:hypothetical protein